MRSDDIMNSMSTRRGTRKRLIQIAVLAASLAAVSACSDFLVAENPGAVEEPDVNNIAYVNLLANAPIFGFQAAYDDVTWWNAQLTDEIVNNNAGNPFAEEGQIDRRELYADMTYIPAFMYSPMQRARYLAEDAARRLVILMPDSAASDLRVARAHAFAGYGYISLGETFCVTPIDLGVPKTPEEMFTDAIGHFNEAITIANAWKTKLQGRTPLDTRGIAGADSVITLSQVGAARAALGKNDKTAARTFALAVPANFEYNLWYGSANSTEWSRFYNRVGAGATNGWMRNTPFDAMVTDPRVPRVLAAQSTARAGVPLSPLMFTTYNGQAGGAGGLPAAEMGHKLATGLEARYIVAEVDGPTASTLAFVNERRAVGQQTPVSLTGAALMAELRDQRARDFYLAGQRLGDLRRYLRYDSINLFPTGPYPGSTTGQVYDNSITCWPLPTIEVNANPNI
jgi:hypothetical protein